jgi:hypothetical protein
VPNEELILSVSDDVAGYFLRHHLPDGNKSKMRLRKRDPVGTFPCFKYYISGTKKILALFEGSRVPLILRKYFATRSAFEDKLVERQNPLMINIDRDNEAQPSDGGMVFVKTTHHVHWLACDVPQSQEETSPCRDLQVIWWPSLLPQSGLGSISFKFNYVHVRNGERQHANLPIAPVVARDYHFTDCLRWRVTTPSTPEQPALVLRFTMLA